MGEPAAVPSSSPSPRLDLVFAGQASLAVALPWAAGRLLSSDQAIWAVVLLLGVGAFAWVERSRRLVWLLPVSALASLLPVLMPQIPSAWGIPSGLMALVVAVVMAAVGTRGPAPASPSRRASGVVGWALIATGALTAALAIVVVRSGDSSFEQGQEQAAIAWEDESWDAPLVASGAVGAGQGDGAESFSLGEPPRVAGTGSSAAATVAPPLATLAFRRPGSDTPLVTSGVLYVGGDVSEQTLSRGPGHYPDTSAPGRAGNFAVAGHRTGWGSPFLELDSLEPGDEVVVTDRAGREHPYVVDDRRLVAPEDDWVLGRDPLGTGLPTLTLTTCDPPGVNDRRLIVFATLADPDGPTQVTAPSEA
ncbi:MAG: sortase [Actinomycetota bacterium]|jgi:sortase A|nr:sortase [Actinomycetota bacterium]